MALSSAKIWSWLYRWGQGVATLDLRSVALFRMGLGLLILLDLAIRASALEAHYTDAGLVPRSVVIGEDGRGTSRIVFHLAFGGTVGTSALFLLAAGFAVSLLIGYRSRLSALVSWVLLLSLQGRNEAVLNGGDVMFRMLLFWAQFLPLGARLSVDRALALRAWGAAAPARAEEAHGFSGGGALGLLAQLFCVYYFAAQIKLCQSAWHEGLGVQYAVWADPYVKEAGTWLRNFPAFLRAASWGTLVFEAAAPFLLLLPDRRGRVRLALALSFVGFHLGLEVALHVGLFSLVACAGWAAALPASFWELGLAARAAGALERASDRAASVVERLFGEIAPRRPLPSRWLGWAALAPIAYVVAWNIGTIPGYAPLIPQPLVRVGLALGLDQRWNMFSQPILSIGWLVAPGKLSDGTLVDALDGGRPLASERPQPVSAEYASDRWRKLYLGIQDQHADKLRLGLGRYLCRRWNERAAPGKSLEALQIVRLEQWLKPRGEGFQETVSKQVLWSHECQMGQLGRWLAELERSVPVGRDLASP